ncbi:MAG: hypothetical protein JHD28_00060 [Bacteroidia bacterium]|nr:hypothetical protein [Bacteroidia bacterium]
MSRGFRKFSGLKSLEGLEGLESLEVYLLFDFRISIRPCMSHAGGISFALTDTFLSFDTLPPL